MRREFFGLRMARIILHSNLANDELNEERLRQDFDCTHEERMRKAFNLMKLAILFSNKRNAKFQKGIKLKVG